MKTTSQIFAASAAMALVLFATAGRADSDASIEWKTYSQVASPGDGILSCTGLKNTITQIETEPPRLRIQTRRLVRNFAIVSLSLSVLALCLRLQRYGSRPATVR